MLSPLPYDPPSTETEWVMKPFAVPTMSFASRLVASTFSSSNTVSAVLAKVIW